MEPDNPQRVYATALAKHEAQTETKATRKEQHKRLWRRESVPFVRAAAANAAGTVIGGTLLALGAQALGYLGGLDRYSLIPAAVVVVSLAVSTYTGWSAKHAGDREEWAKLELLRTAALQHLVDYGPDPGVPKNVLHRDMAKEDGSGTDANEP